MRKILLIGALSAGLIVPGTAALASVPHVGTTTATYAKLQVLNDPDSGFCGNWATDNLLRSFKVTSLGHGTYAVSTNDAGSWIATPGAIAPLNPTCDPAAVMGHESGRLTGYDTFTVVASGPASERNLIRALKPYLIYSKVFYPTVNGADVTFGQIVLDLFPAGASYAPGGEFTTWYDRYKLVTGPGTSEIQVQAYTGYSDTPVGVFTNGGLSLPGFTVSRRHQCSGTRYGHASMQASAERVIHIDVNDQPGGQGQGEDDHRGHDQFPPHGRHRITEA